ncbi:MAG: hypothetical protein GKS06_06150 [Acidobacteria bacterium]|nr:hypothetical protein [Acidobacteriota bacterium]
MRATSAGLMVLCALTSATASRAATPQGGEFRTVSFSARDGLEITADLYAGASQAAPTVLLFHQSSSSRGEFRVTGQRLASLGFNALAVDLRWGLRRDGVTNETAARHGTPALMEAVEAGTASPWPTIDAAYQDMRAARRWLGRQGFSGPVFALGSSASAMLVVRMGAEALVDGVIAYSPGEYDDDRPHLVRDWAGQLTVPFYAVAAPDEDDLVAPIVAAAPERPRAVYFKASDGRHGASILDVGDRNWLDLASTLSTWTGGLPIGTEFTISTATNVELIADRYDLADPRATILLFHQGGGSARGEYGFLIPHLLARNYAVVAVDLYGGGDRFGRPNRTLRGSSPPDDFGYCDAGSQIRSVINHVGESTNRPMVLWGSSYTAALVVRETARDAVGVAATLAFSPASGEPLADCIPEEVADELTVPVLTIRPESEAAMESVATQIEAFRAAGVATYVAPGAHGSSLLNPARSPEGRTAQDYVFDFLERFVSR